MFWPWFGDWGWFAGLMSVLVWIGIIVLAVWLLRREIPHLRVGNRTPALDLLEERYARGEISRDEFLERRAVLLQATRSEAPPPPPPPEQAASERAETDETQPLPPNAPGT